MPRPREAITQESGPKVDKRNRKRFIVYADENGRPDPATIPDELKGVIPEAAPGEPAAPPPPPKEFNPAIFGMLLPAIVGIEAALIAPKMGVDVSIARNALIPPPPMADSLAAAMAAVANKYGGTLGQWEAEIGLALLIVTWQAGAFSEIRRYQAANAPKFEPPPPSREKHESTPAAPPPPPPPPPPPIEKPTELPLDAAIFAGADS